MNKGITQIMLPCHLTEAFEAFKKSQQKDKLVAKFEIGSFLDKGGFADIYEIDNGNEPLVLKVVDSFDAAKIKQNGNVSPEHVCKRTEFEAVAMERCAGCVNIMPLRYYFKYEVDPDNFHNVYLFIMPKYQNVFDLFAKNKLITEKDLLRILNGISNALITCKENNILHRDVRLPNIYVKHLNGTDVYILSDFGVAKNGVQREIVNGNPKRHTRLFGANLPPENSKDVDYDFNFDVYMLCKDIMDFAKERIELSQGLKSILENGMISDLNKRSHAYDINSSSNYFLKEQEDINHNPANTPKTTKIDPVKYANKIKGLILTDDNLEEAINLAYEGHKLNLSTCSRLYAYLLWKQSPTKEDFEKSGGGKILDKLISDKDSKAKGLRGFFNISYAIKANKNGKPEDYILLEESAIEGCVFAAHYYGRWLFDGNANGLPRDRKKGLNIIFHQAINEKYPPAYVYLEKLIKRGYDKYIHEHSPAYEDMIKLELKNRKIDANEPNFYRKHFILGL